MCHFLDDVCHQIIHTILIGTFWLKILSVKLLALSLRKKSRFFLHVSDKALFCYEIHILFWRSVRYSCIYATLSYSIINLENFSNNQILAFKHKNSFFLDEVLKRRNTIYWVLTVICILQGFCSQLNHSRGIPDLGFGTSSRISIWRTLKPDLQY